MRDAALVGQNHSEERHGDPPGATEYRSVPSRTDASERPDETLALTPVQRDILVLVVNGLTNWQIADRLGLRPGLIGTHIGRITRALGVTSRAELAAIGTGGEPRTTSSSTCSNRSDQPSTGC